MARGPGTMGRHDPDAFEGGNTMLRPQPQGLERLCHQTRDRQPYLGAVPPCMYPTRWVAALLRYGTACAYPLTGVLFVSAEYQIHPDFPHNKAWSKQECFIDPTR